MYGTGNTHIILVENPDDKETKWKHRRDGQKMLKWTLKK